MSKRPDFGKVISSVINKISKDRLFKRSLTYLLLTSKSESVLRDQLAFGLHEKLHAKDEAVAREWYRTDIAVLAPVLVGKTKQFKAPKAIIEIKMVAAPGKENKNIRKHLKKLQCQLKDRKDKWPNAELFGLFVVRVLSETSPNSTSAFNEKFIKSKRESLSSNPNFHRRVKILAKKLNLRQVNQKCLELFCGEDKIVKARVNLKMWLFSLR